MSSERPNSRDAILDAAFALLSAGTLVRLEDVAKAAGVSRQAIYLHFKNRNELVVAVVDRARADPGVAAVLDLHTQATTPAEVLRAFAHAVATLHERSAAANLTVEALCRTDRDLAAAWARRPAGRMSAARAAARRMDRADVLALPADRAGELLHALTGPGLYDHLVLREGWSARTYETHLARLLVVALVAPGREDVALPVDDSNKGKKENGTDSSGGRNPGDPGGRVEPRGRGGVRRAVRG